jgi:hypothetical protein
MKLIFTQIILFGMIALLWSQNENQHQILTFSLSCGGVTNAINDNYELSAMIGAVVGDEMKNDHYWLYHTFFPALIVTDIGPFDYITNLPQFYKLRQNYPNPFNPKTVISYQLPVNSHVELNIYNIIGQKVATLVNTKQPAGYHQVEWNANGFASGNYFYRLQAGTHVETKKMILRK